MKKSYKSILKVLIFAILLNIIFMPNIAKADDFDFDEAIIYFLLTDRFNNGDTSNDNPNGENYDKSHLETYHGGDFQGLIDKLDYLKDLGVNTIWITPIVDNINFNLRYGKDAQYGYHGYWAKDFTKIDEHLGDLDTFKKLIDEIHDRNMKLMVDVVINHTGYGLKSTDSNTEIPNYPTDENREVFKDMLRLEPTNGHPITGELAGLPDFITEDENVRNQVIAWQKDWIEKARTEKGNTIDYFRVDTVKHVELETLKAFKDQVVQIKPDFKMIGEYFDGSVHFNGSVMDQGGMDSILDFEFKGIVRDYLRGNFEEAEKKLQIRNDKLTEDKTTGQFLSSHDENGFLAMRLSGDEGLFKVAATLQLTAKGQPVIYYGEEIGLSGKNAGNMDNGEFSENRYDFDWSKVESNSMLDHYKKLLTIRNENTDIFTKGTRKSIYANKDNGISIFEREYNGEFIITFVNIGEMEQTITFSKSSGSARVDNIYANKELEAKNDISYELLIPSKNDGGTTIIKTDSSIKDVNIIDIAQDDENYTDQNETSNDEKLDDSDKQSVFRFEWILIAIVIVAILFVIVRYFKHLNKK